MDGDYDAIENPPKATIEGAPAIKKYHILNDKRHILAQDSKGNVSLYDVLKVSAYFIDLLCLFLFWNSHRDFSSV